MIHSTGFVYVLTNQYMPGLVKVGFTSMLAEDRARALFTTGVPAPFTVEYRSLTSRPKDVESKCHELLRERRVNESREFFQSSVEEAIEAVRIAAVEAAGIKSWKTQRPHTFHPGDRIALSLERGQSFVHFFYPDERALFSGAAEILDIYQAHSNGDLLEVIATNSASHVAGFATDDPGGSVDPVPYLDREGRSVNGFINGREIFFPGERLVWLPSPDQATHQAAVVFESCAYCQLVSRTWSPRITPEGFPMLLNVYTHGEMPPELAQAVKSALALPAPRSWSPRTDYDRGSFGIGTAPQPPEYWLPQLEARKKKG